MRNRASGYGNISRRLRGQRELTVVVTTHYIEEVEGCDRVCIIDRGQILAIDTPAALKASRGQQLLRVVPREEATAAEIMRAYPDMTIRRNDEIIVKSARRRIRGSIPVALWQPHSSSFGRGAESGERVPLPDRSRDPRPDGRCTRTNPCVRPAGRGAHAMSDATAVHSTGSATRSACSAEAFTQSGSVR